MPSEPETDALRTYLSRIPEPFSADRRPAAVGRARQTWAANEARWRRLAARARLSVADTQVAAVWFHEAHAHSRASRPERVLAAALEMAARWRRPVRVPRSVSGRQDVTLWGQPHRVKPALAHAVLGDGRTLLGFQTLNYRPNYYLIRVDSRAAAADPDARRDDFVEEVIDALADEFSTIEREYEHLREDGWTDAEIDSPKGWRLTDFPVLSLDCGYCWWTEIEPAAPERGVIFPEDV